MALKLLRYNSYNPPMNRIYLPLLLLILLSSCNAAKKLELMKSGSVEQKDYITTVPFEFRAGLPIIKATVNGKEGWFLFDTGAPNVLSKAFAEKLNLSTLATGSVSDSGGNTLNDQGYVQISDIKIGDINFKNTGAIIQDLSASAIFKCLDFDGIIGANLMRNAYWKIDYINEEITFSDALNNLKTIESYKSIPFRAKISGTPVVDIQLNDLTVKNITFDTGSNGELSIPRSAFEALTKIGTLKKTYSVGPQSYGVAGIAKTDTIIYSTIARIKLGEVPLNNKVMEFSAQGHTIGTRFLKNYEVILDWHSNQIYMAKHSEFDYDTVENFGFGLDYRDEGLFVGSLFEDVALKNKLQIGDQILQIDTLDFENGTDDYLCGLILESEWEYAKKDLIDITILRDDEKMSFQLVKRDLLSSK